MGSQRTPPDFVCSEKKSRGCTEICSGKQMKTTKEGFCVVPKLKASVQADALVVELHKPNRHLAGMPLKWNRVVQIEPSANYDINPTVTLRRRPNTAWIRKSPLQRATSKYVKKVQVYFNPTGIPDGSNLTAALEVHDAYDNDQKSSPIVFEAIVMSTPSFERSTMEMSRQSEQGQPVKMTIAAKDEDGMSITHARGRFFEMAWAGPDSVQKTKTSIVQDGHFVVEFSGEELAASGVYQVWCAKVFGFDVKPDSNESNRFVDTGSVSALPTKELPHKLKVHPKTVRRQNECIGRIEPKPGSCTYKASTMNGIGDMH